MRVIEMDYSLAYMLDGITPPLHHEIVSIIRLIDIDIEIILFGL